eukprot:scaffold7808_cov36-Phaeocystis_antarctica.AAC.1
MVDGMPIYSSVPPGQVRRKPTGKKRECKAIADCEPCDACKMRADCGQCKVCTGKTKGKNIKKKCKARICERLALNGSWVAFVASVPGADAHPAAALRQAATAGAGQAMLWVVLAVIAVLVVGQAAAVARSA